jgi:hypothetical protein
MRHFFRQLLIFLTYLCGCSIVLLNKTGGADLLFVILLFLCALIHLIVILFKWAQTRNNNADKNSWNGADFISFVLIIFLYTIVFSYFMNLIHGVILG